MINKYYKVLLAGLVFSIPCLKDSLAGRWDPSIIYSDGKLILRINKCAGNPCYPNYDAYQYTINSDEYTGTIDKDGNVLITSKKDPNISYTQDTIKGNLAFSYKRESVRDYRCGNKNTISYNEDGNVTSQWDYKETKFGGVESSIMKEYTYDENKNMTSETTKTWSNDKNDYITETNNYTYTYDDKNNMLTKSVNGELSETYEYDGENKYTYDANHNLIKTEQYHTDVAGGEYTCNRYCTPPEAASAMPDSDTKYSVTVTF